MHLGSLIARLESDDDAAAALEALGDVVLFARVCAVAQQFDETPWAYVGGAVRRFAAAASSEDWLDLVGALGRTSDPARATLERILAWSIARDEEASEAAEGSELAA